MLKRSFTNSVAFLRLVSFLEGLSLLVLVAIAVPMKYIFDSPALVKAIGPVHGALFLIFILVTLGVSLVRKWKFFWVTVVIMLSSFVPFGMLYIDHKYLKPELRKMTTQS